MGGYICFAMARPAPERMRGLILVDTREAPDTEEARKARYESIAKVKDTGVQPLVDSMLPKMHTPQAPREMRERGREIMSSASPEGVIGALGAMATRPDSTPTLRKIRVPTLILVGEADTITPPSHAERMVSLIAGSRLVRIAGAAHASNVEKATEVNRAVSAFLPSA